jgi:lipopolysaccharide export system permease protein
MIDFETYAIRIKPVKKISETPYPKEMAFGDLLRSNERAHKVEIQWRLSKIAIVPVLAILALAFSSLDVRRGRMGRILGAIGIYFLYSNVLGFAHALLKSEKVPVFMGLWWVHAIFLMFALYMLQRRIANVSLIPRIGLLRR